MGTKLQSETNRNNNQYSLPSKTNRNNNTVFSAIRNKQKQQYSILCHQKQTETTIQYSLPSKTTMYSLPSETNKNNNTVFFAISNNSTGFSAIRNKQKQQYSLPSETIQYSLPSIKIVKSMNFTEQDSRLLYLIREIKTWLNINHITMYTITHISYFKTQRTVIENTKVT